VNDKSFAQFESEARTRGADQVMERRWEPRTEVKPHSHPFDADALVVEGEMWLTVGGATRHLLPGDTFAIPRGVEHSERYGEQGATFWVGRRANAG
jgi:quercetin dioxygenase-like cupin family protein